MTHCDGTTIDASSGFVSGTIATGGPFTKFSPFGVSSLIALLPITINNFNVRNNINQNKISWNGLNEATVKIYEVQKSDNGISFSTIGKLEKLLGTYSFNDLLPLQGANYYRLKITSINSVIEYSNEIKLVNTIQGKKIAVYTTMCTKQVNLISRTATF